MIKEVVSQFGSLDVLVNNAGITRDNLLMRMKEHEWDDVINTNLKGTFNCIQKATPQMLRQRGGAIINLSSIVGAMGNPGQANYVATKAGIEGLTKSSARELASRGITVNAVAPGFIVSDMTDALSDDLKSQMLEQIPLSRFGEDTDIANTVAFLASDRAKIYYWPNNPCQWWHVHVIEVLEFYYQCLRNACILPIKMGKYSSLWIDTFKGGESTWKTSIK